MISQTPKYEISNGIITLSGRSLLEDADEFYNPFFRLLKTICKEKQDLIFNFKLDYYNTVSTRYISYILNILKDYSKQAKVTVNWYYLGTKGDVRNFDEDIQEQGQIMKETFYSELNILER